MANPQVPVGLANSQFFVRENKHWAVEQENYRHDQALYSIGEPAMFIMLWRVEDHEHGYVRRCPRCYEGKLAESVEVYQQSTVNRCPRCYGTTFEGGIRAKIIRPATFTDVDDQEQYGQHGTTYPLTVSVESTSDFRYRNGDFVFRADGSRWQLDTPQRVTLRTGYGHPSQAQDSIGYATTTASLEDNTSVAWMIPPNKADLMEILTAPSRYPVTNADVVNAPLIPDAWVD